MRINQQHPDFDKLLVFLDGKWIRAAIEADDAEGWVIIPDIASLAPLPAEQDDFDTDFAPGEETVDEWEEMKTIKKFGRVEFRHIPS
jgi:hypothetical protein